MDSLFSILRRRVRDDIFVVPMIPEEYFRNTEINMPVRYRHPGCTDPSKDKALVVTRTHSGWKWFCHRCRMGGVKPIDSLSPSRLVKFTNDQKVKVFEKVDEVRLPRDFTEKIPPEGLAWLYSYGITDEEISQYSIGYSKLLSRVILPTYMYGELVFWIGRLIGEPSKTNPKYSSVAVSRKDIYFTAENRFSRDVVIVEDNLSAIKVGRIATAIALISVHVPDGLVFHLARHYARIVLWLDPDKHKKMIRLCRRYQANGINVIFIASRQDPKYYSDEVIEKELS